MTQTPILERAVRVVEDPLTGSIPTWRMDDERIYWETVDELGDPSRAALDARVVALPDPAGAVVTGVLTVVAS